MEFRAMASGEKKRMYYDARSDTVLCHAFVRREIVIDALSFFSIESRDKDSAFDRFFKFVEVDPSGLNFSAIEAIRTKLLLNNPLDPLTPDEKRIMVDTVNFMQIVIGK
jgi:hypothetical protein